MANRLVEMLRRNVVTAFVVVGLPLVAAMALLGVMIWKGYANAWGYGYAALLVALVVEYPYLKLCDRFIFK
jgi:hypothetical protein